MDEEHYKYLQTRPQINFHPIGEDDFPKCDNFAIVIPYRDRMNHLNRFLNNRNIKKLNTTIYVFEQAFGKRFNRGALFNAACRELADKHERLILHDVDLLPNEKMAEYYYADSDVIHLSLPEISHKYDYHHYFGGVLSISVSDYQKINGFPNNFFGWGAEDDALYNRVAGANLKVYRPTSGDYFVIDHQAPSSGAKNPFMREMEIDDYNDSVKEGLNEIKYDLLGIEKTSQFIKYTVDF